MRAKKIFLIILLLGVLGSVGAGIYYWRVASQKSVVTEVSMLVSPTPAVEEVALWEDQAGFTFSYPKSLKSNIHEEDTQNYAHIEFTHPDHSGSIIVWAKDTTAVDATAWIKSEKIFVGATVLDTTFADMEGKKLLVTNPKRKVITAVVDEAIVFYVEGDFENSDFWTTTYDTITSSFAFAGDSSTQSTSSSDEDSQEVMVDEEEVLE